MKKIVLAAALFALSGSAYAVCRVDSCTVSCDQLHSMVASEHFVFLTNPDFQDFIVADASYCGGGERIQVRSVRTTDCEECPVNYCMPHTGNGG